MIRANLRNGIRGRLGLAPRCYSYNYSQPYTGDKSNSNYDYSSANGNTQSNHDNNHNSNYTRPSWLSKLTQSFLIFSAVSGAAYYLWWPKHTFPSSVAKILRKGLWAESDKGEHDYQLALRHYLEALAHCNTLGLDPLLDEYTGIQLKIGEMFERLSMTSDAAFIYNEIATLYLSILTSDSKRITSVDHRRHLIQKDLRIAMKLALMNQDNPVLAKSILMTHLLIAQDEINKNSTYNKSIKLISKESSEALIEDDNIIVTNGGTKTKIEKIPQVWEPFAEEYFSAMDYLSVLCVVGGDINMGVRVKISANEGMMLADQHWDKILLSQCNLGSLLYLQSGEFDTQEINIKKKFAEKCDLNYKTLLAKRLVFEPTNDEDLNKINETISSKEKKDYNLIIHAKTKCLDLAAKLYNSVIEFAKNLPPDVVKSNVNVNESVALATYGLGVVNLNSSKYDLAEKYLREARVRSKNCGYTELLENIEDELEKVFKEQENLRLGLSPSGKSKINMDVHAISRVNK